MEEKEFSEKVRNYLKLNIYLLIAISSILVIYTHDIKILITSFITTIIGGIIFFTFAFFIFRLAFYGSEKFDHQDQKGTLSKANLRKSYFWITFSHILVGVLASFVFGYVFLFEISLYGFMGLLVGDILKKRFNN